MPTPNDATGVIDGDTLREFLIARVIYPLDENEDPEDFVALDVASGAIPKGLAWHESIFWLDADDSITAHDGTTTLVTLDGYRYKVSALDLRNTSVLDRDLTTPPVSPTLGDAYLVPAGATDDWDDFDDYVAIYTARGWEFIEPKIGSWILIEDEDVFSRYTAAGAWEDGPGDLTAGSDSIPLSALINVGRGGIRVVNQTTNTPPSVPQGNAYIIGSSPTGAWAGHVGKVAIRETAGTNDTYAIYTPAAGWKAYDIATAADLIFNGTAWISAAGVWVGKTGPVATASGSTATGGSGEDTYDPATPPTTAAAFIRDTATLSHTARASGKTLRFNYRAVLVAAVAADCLAALFRDSDSNAIDWIPVNIINGNVAIQVQFNATSSDTSAHTYHVRIVNLTAVTPDLPSALERRSFMVEEAA